MLIQGHCMINALLISIKGNANMAICDFTGVQVLPFCFDELEGNLIM